VDCWAQALVPFFHRIRGVIVLQSNPFSPSKEHSMKLSLSCPCRRSLALFVGMLATSLVLLWLAQSAPAQSASDKRPLTHNDYDIWNTIQSPLLSPDGKIAAYTLVKANGTSELVIVDLRNGKEYRHNRGGGGGKGGAAAKGGKGPEAAPAAGAGAGKAAFTDDSKRLVFTIAPPGKGAAKKADTDKEQDKGAAPVRPSLGIMDLADGSVKVIPGVRSFLLPENSSGGVVYHKAPTTADAADKKGDGSDIDDEDEIDDFLFLQVKGKKGGGGVQKKGGAPAAKAAPTDLVLHRFEDGSEFTIADVTDFTMTRDGRVVVCVVAPKDNAEGSGVFAYLTGSAQGKVPPLSLAKGKARYSRFTWDEEQRYLAFFADHGASPKEPGPIGLHLWDRDNLKMPDNSQPAVEILNSTNTTGLKDGCVLTDRGTLSFSNDGARIVVSVAPPQAALPPEPEAKQPTAKDGKVVVELWHWKDDFIQPMQKVRNQQEKGRTFVAQYNVKTKKLVQLADKDCPVVAVAPDGNSAVGTDDHQYRTLVGQDTTYADIYLVNINDGKRKLLLKKHHGGITFSPRGKYAIFYDGKDWNTITLPSGMLTNITKKIEKAKFFNEDFDSPSPPPAHGIAGWTNDETAVILYDKYDIWEIGVRGSSQRNLTSFGGAKDRAQLRYVKLDPKEKGINAEQPMLLRFENYVSRESGLAVLDPRTGQITGKPLVQPYSLSVPTKAKYGDKFMFTAQSFYRYPDLFVVDSSLKEPKRISDANPQKDQFIWGKSEIIHYHNVDGAVLSGMLIRPENFDPSKKYPMLVYIYEKLSQNVHHFVLPKEGTSINPTYYASNGYLVFMPDIVYTIGYPGQSALKCVLPGIQAVVNTGCVQEDAIGIQGHSWGGYQIAYMVTQTGRFKAAAAGAPVANMTSAYDGIRWGTGLPRQFQYEKTQSRIGGSLWEYPMRFVENSPVFMADRVKTPLLMLHNDQDDAVPWYQGIEYYLALRRLGKEVYLFNYPGELHGLRSKANQKDYTIRMQEFFDHHLRGAPMPEWMKSGIPYTPRGPTKEPAGGGEGG
jgi:dipeptidyl aminopeptidase/acylaminoacyl peptidase